MLDDSCFASLEGLAIANRYDTLVNSRGLCLHASVEFGREARRLGIDSRLFFVRWRVRNDLNYLEHWAVATENGRVLDLTAVQVDGDPRPLRRVEEYPVNYVRPRLYPASVVLDAMTGHVLTADHHYLRRQVWRLHLQLFRHDAAEAVWSASPRALYEAIAAISRCCFSLSAGYLLERVLARAVTLLSSLNSVR